MFEAIAANRRRSLVLIALMGALLALLGGVIGWMVALYADDVVNVVGERSGQARLTGQLIRTQTGLYWGITIAVGMWLIMWLAAISQGESILLRSAKAHEITKADAPQLWNTVEEMTIASGLGKIPRVFIIDDASMNAFAVGLKPERAAVAVTSGLLKRLNRDELQGVIAHEIGHIRNLDSKFMTMAGVMVGAIVLISQIFLRGMFYGSMGRRRSSSREGGGAAIVMLVIAILVAILAPIAAQMLYFACSRRREYLADASAARYTRFPPGLASALEKISRKPAAAKDVNKVVAPMYIVNPLQAQSALGLMSTHPPTKERIRILRSMAGAGFAAYEEAFRQTRKGEHCIGSQTLASDSAVDIREASKEKAAKKAEAVERAQQVTGLLDRIINFTIIPCMCGVKLKLPPEFKRSALDCPRCGRTHPVPGVGGHAGKLPPPPPEKMTYHRQGKGWEVFQCGACGHNVQLSPNFAAKYTNCPKCNRRIEIT